MSVDGRYAGGGASCVLQWRPVARGDGGGVVQREGGGANRAGRQALGEARPIKFPIEWRRGGAGQIRSTGVVNGGDKEAGRNAAVHPCAGSSSGANPDAAPLLRRAVSARRRARLRRWWPRRRRRPGRPCRPVRPSSSPAGEALRLLLHAVRAVAEAAARPRQAREDQVVPVHQPRVRVHERAGIFRLLRLPAAHPGIIRRGQGRRLVAASHREDAEQCGLQGRPRHPLWSLHRGGDGRRRGAGRDGVPGEERRRRGGVPVHGHQGHLRLPLHHRRRRLQGAEAEDRRHLAGARMVRPGHPVIHGLRRRRRLSSVTTDDREVGGPIIDSSIGWSRCRYMLVCIN